MSNDQKFVNAANTLLEKLTILLQKEEPSMADCKNIVLSCTKL